MLIEFDKLDTTVIDHFKGGEGKLKAQMYVDDLGKIMHGHLDKGSSIGLHLHEDSSEVIYVLSGTATAYVNGHKEKLRPGVATYCPMDSDHEITDVCDDDLDFIAVVPFH